jgi:hypothetical protein
MLFQNYTVKREMKKKCSSKPSKKWKRKSTLASYGDYILHFQPFTTFDR